MSFLSRTSTLFTRPLQHSRSHHQPQRIILPFVTQLQQQHARHPTLVQPRRFFATEDVPVLPESIREPDNIYRRPQRLPYSAPLSIDSELMWDDAQAPEPTFDMFEDGPPASEALRHLIYAFMMLGGVFGIIAYWRWEPHVPVIDQIWPYNNLRLELGGLNGAKSSEGKREGFYTPTAEEKKLAEGEDEEE